MCAAPRFKESAYNRRPYGCHRYDVFSPKLQRQVTLFGRHALDLWTTLEASPQVISFCERPMLIPDVAPKRPFDFWVHRAHGDEFLILLNPSESLDGPGRHAGVGGLADTVLAGGTVRCLNPREMEQHRIALTNWGWIIRDLAAFGRFIPPAVRNDVRNALEGGKTIAQLQTELSTVDASTIKLAVFALLHRGQAICHQLATEQLGPNHLIEAP